MTFHGTNVVSGNSGLTLLIRTSTQGTSGDTYGEFLLRMNTIHYLKAIGDDLPTYPTVRLNSAGLLTVRMKGTTAQQYTVGISIRRI